MDLFKSACQKAANGERLDLEEALALYADADLLDLAAWARAVKEHKSGKKVYIKAWNLEFRAFLYTFGGA